MLSIGVIIFASMTIIVFTQVVMRYIFDAIIIWAEEFLRYGMIWIIFLVLQIVDIVKNQIIVLSSGFL